MSLPGAIPGACAPVINTGGMPYDADGPAGGPAGRGGGSSSEVVHVPLASSEHASDEPAPSRRFFFLGSLSSRHLSPRCLVGDWAAAAADKVWARPSPPPSGRDDGRGEGVPGGARVWRGLRAMQHAGSYAVVHRWAAELVVTHCASSVVRGSVWGG